MGRLRGLLAACYSLLIVVTAIVPLLGGPRSYAPFSLIPEREPVTVVILAASELADWIRPATDAFNNSGQRVQGRLITVTLNTVGSGDLINLVEQPVAAIIPANTLWLDQLKRRRPEIVVAQPQSVARSPLVVLSWQDRAPLLFPQGQVDWQRLQAALADGSANSWLKLGGRAEWGTVKFGHTSPLRSNSGLATMLLLLAAHSGTEQPTAADVQGEGFMTWLQAFESGVQRPLPTSSSDMLQRMLSIGPAAFDAITIPENLVAGSAARARGSLAVVYPQPTLWFDYPFTPVTTDPDALAAALQFRAFLRSTAQQQAALGVGLRPVEGSGVQLSAAVPNNPFTAQQFGLTADEPRNLLLPPPETVTAMLDVWQQRFNR